MIKYFTYFKELSTKNYQLNIAFCNFVYQVSGRKVVLILFLSKQMGKRQRFIGLINI